MRGIDEILRRPQRIDDNLSSRQQFLVLDSMLLRALEPLAATTPTYLESVAEIMASAVFARRKLDADARSACFAAFFATDRVSAVEAIVEANVDRGYALSYLSKVLDIGTRFETAHVEVARHRNGRVEAKYMSDLSQCSASLGNDPLIVPALRTARYWYDATIDFRDQIVEKYYRLTVQNAYRAARKQPASIEARDVFSAGIVSACRAIERFDSRSGVLTTYLARWLRGSSTGTGVQSIGRAYSVKSRKKDDSSWSVPLDNLPDIEDAGAAADATIDVPLALIRAEALAQDPDVKAVLMISGLTPSAAFTRSRVNIPADELTKERGRT